MKQLIFILLVLFAVMSPAQTEAMIGTAPEGFTTKRTFKEKVAMKIAKKQLKKKPKKVNRKVQAVALILCIFLGLIGIHRFYLGYTGMGILYLFTLGLSNAPSNPNF